MIRFAWCMAVMAALLCPLSASAEIYKYVSASGEIVLLDYPLKAEEMQARGLRLFGSEPSTPPKPQPVLEQEESAREKQLQMDTIRAAESAETSARPKPASFGDLRIDETLPRRGSTELHVTYTNNTLLTFTTSVEIRCQAFKDGKIVAGSTAHIFAKELGAITPGFAIQKVISVAHELVDPVDEVKCEVLEGQ